MANISTDGTQDPDPPDNPSLSQILHDPIPNSSLDLSQSNININHQSSTFDNRASRRIKRPRQQSTDDEIGCNSASCSGQKETLPRQETPRERKTRLQREKRHRESSTVRVVAQTSENLQDPSRRLSADADQTAAARSRFTDEVMARDLPSCSGHNEENFPQQETPRERKTRLQREKRHRESSTQRAHRLSVDAQLKAVARARETSEERSRRLSADAEQTAAARSRETPEGQARRRSLNAQHMTASRNTETSVERSRRQSSNAQQMAAVRDRESSVERSRRQSSNAQQMAAVRDRESSVERSRRQSSNAQQMAAVRDRESSVERATRQSSNAQQVAASRSNLSSAQISNRREQERSRYHVRNMLSLHDVPVGYSSEFVAEHCIGPMDVVCAGCQAKYFRGEANLRDRRANICCNFGSISIDHFTDFPDRLKTLFVGSTPSSCNFRNNIRNFNSSLAMASMGAQITVPSGSGPYCYKVHGQVYHHVGSLQPPPGVSPKFGQLYILDTKQAADERMGKPYNSKCDPSTMKCLSDLIFELNPYAQSFKMMYKVAQEEERKAAALQIPRPTLRMIFHVDPSVDQRRYNVPDSNEVAAVFVGEDNDVPPTRSIAVHLTGGRLQSLRDTDKLCDPLTYPLFFPTGKFGWHPEMVRSAESNPDRRRLRITHREYYSFLLSIRESFNPLIHGCKLFQQFVVDSWVKIEQNRLNFARTHQAELRSDAYQSLLDHVNTGVDSTVPGARIVLPSSFSGTPRNMQQGYQDGMSIVTKYGKPTYFMTVTCNPKWKEILENLLPHQTASDRPDLVARVFNMKLKALFDDLFKNHVLGEVLAYISVVEWQKRGLPHCHLLLTMKPNFRPRTPEQVDQVIRAFLPDPDTEPELFNIVSTAMMHKNCGVHNPHAPCMKDGICSKQYPKRLQDQTELQDDAFPLYRRPNNGQTVTIGNVDYDNRWVVPHNAYLCLRFNAHINLEICSMVHAVKYLYKYVYKGVDRATLRLKQVEQTANGQPIDEIKAHLDTRYICAPEAIHRIFEFDVQRKSDVVYRLQVHLPEQQNVVFKEGQLDVALQRAESKLTTLTAWFKINREYDSTSADASVNPRDYLYINFPEHFTFVKTSGLWKVRQRGIRQIGRMYMASPRDRERYCLRLLLLNRAGMTSFEDMRTVNGHVFPSFSAAAKEMGLLRDENNVDRTMAEAVVFGMPAQLRSLFGALLAFTDVMDAPALWEKYRKHLSEDYLHRGYGQEESYTHAYFDILDSTSCMGLDLRTYIPAPAQTRPVSVNQQLSLFDHANIGSDYYAKLTVGQKVAADAILIAPCPDTSSCFFVDGPGGSGKTFLYNCLYHIFLGQGKKVVCAAFTGIAANLLPEGRTLHSVFKLSIPQGNRISTIKNQSKEAQFLREADVFIVDECSMIPRWSLDAIDRLLRDTMSNDIPFGGKKLILGGDFRQVLPVVERGSSSDAVDACLKQSSLFTIFNKFTLTQNMRTVPGSDDWSDFLLSVGNGSIGEDQEGCISLPESIISHGDLLSEIFEDRFDEPDVFSDRAILAPKNVDVNEMNENVLEKLSGRARTFRSIDEVDSEDPDDVINFPVEFLHKQNPAGSPPHLLNLKVGCVVMLLRNLDVSRGLCNGTRLVVVDFSTRVLHCKFICGNRKGTGVFIPRIDNFTEKGLPFRLRRRQFPVRLAFAMTVNKSQGQSLTHVGLYLPQSVFGHGQLYVALSRARSMQGVKVLSISKKYKNVVERSVL